MSYMRFEGIVSSGECLATSYYRTPTLPKVVTVPWYPSHQLDLFWRAQGCRKGETLFAAIAWTIYFVSIFLVPILLVHCSLIMLLADLAVFCGASGVTEALMEWRRR